MKRGGGAVGSSALLPAALAVALFGCGAKPAPPLASPEPPAAVHRQPSAGQPTVLVPAERAPKTEKALPLRTGRAGRMAFVLDEAGLFRDAPAPPSAAPEPIETWRELKRITVGKSHLATAEFFPDERRLFASSDADNHLRVYELPSGKLLSEAAVDGLGAFARASFLVWPFESCDPCVLFASDAGIDLLDAETGRSTAELSPDGAWQLRITADLVGAARSEIPAQKGSLTLYRASAEPALEAVARFEFDERVDDWVMSRDRRRLGVVYYPSNEVEWIDLALGRVLWTARAPQYAHTLDLSPDETRLAVGGSEVRVFDVRDPARRSGFAEFDNNIDCVRFAPAGDALFVSSYDGHVRVLTAGLDAPVLRLRKKLRHSGTANVYALDFARGGALLVSSSGDRTLRVWGRGGL